MKYHILALGLVLSSIALSGTVTWADPISIKKVVEVPHANEAQLIKKVSSWASTYSQTNTVNAESGIVLAQGEIAYPSPSIDRIQYTILFEMKNQIRGNKNTVTFEKIMLKSPTTYLPESSEEIPGQTKPVVSGKDVLAVTKSLNRLADNLEAYLLGKSSESCSLVKCPECSVLYPSSEEMKDHHGHTKCPHGHGSTPEK